MKLSLHALAAVGIAAFAGALWIARPGTSSAAAADGPGEVLGRAPVPEEFPVAVVRHRWQVKIAESNHVAIRPGSVYDIVTYFEENLDVPRPGFNYLFMDLGLGTADPLYPIFQRGHQASWAQLLPAMWSKHDRHIDHSSVIDTPEGCRVYSTYWVRHIDEFPDRYRAERAAGYTLVDISFNHYVRLRPDAQCGRHVSHPPDPSFHPRAYIAQFADHFKSFDQIPPEMLARYEAKIGLLKLVSETFDRHRWPRFRDVYTFDKNSLWYYPHGIPDDYGLVTPRDQGPGLPALRPGDLVIPATPALQAGLGLDRVLDADTFRRFVELVDGHPYPGFDPATEPGHDALSFDEITRKNFYTSGLDVIPIGSPAEVRAHVSKPSSFRLAGIVIRPYQDEADHRWSGTRVIPQLRLVYQLCAPARAGGPARPVEQLYLHLNFDAVDRDAGPAARDADHRRFLARVAEVARLRRAGDPRWEPAARALAETYAARPVQNLAFSSDLTGIWVFGALSRSQSADDTLRPLRIVREGVDVGYYSTVYDTVLFRKAAAAGGERAPALRADLDALTPHSYRDPRRSDPHQIRFQRMTCAQCHQMAGRDAVHVALNDHLDRRYTRPTRPTEFVLREIDRQLERGAAFWAGRSPGG